MLERNNEICEWNYFFLISRETDFAKKRTIWDNSEQLSRDRKAIFGNVGPPQRPTAVCKPQPQTASKKSPRSTKKNINNTYVQFVGGLQMLHVHHLRGEKLLERKNKEL